MDRYFEVWLKCRELMPFTVILRLFNREQWVTGQSQKSKLSKGRATNELEMERPLKDLNTFL